MYSYLEYTLVYRWSVRYYETAIPTSYEYRYQYESINQATSIRVVSRVQSTLRRDHLGYANS